VPPAENYSPAMFRTSTQGTIKATDIGEEMHEAFQMRNGGGEGASLLNKKDLMYGGKVLAAAKCMKKWRK
jgi:hypothetical protein